MRKVIFICFVAATIVMFGSMAMAGKPGMCLPTPPANFTCPTDSTGVNFAWDVLAGATKYSIDVVVVSEDGLTTVEQSFSSDTNSLSVPFTDFLICGTATAKVKGLNPPQKGACSQNNAFSAECVFTIPCAQQSGKARRSISDRGAGISPLQIGFNLIILRGLLFGVR